MPVIELDRAAEKGTRGFSSAQAFEVVKTSEAAATCPFRAVCTSPLCDGDWMKSDCPSNSKGS